MKLQQYRELRQLTRQEAADELGVTKTAYWRWENGQSVPTADRLRQIAKWSEGAVTPNDFVRW